MSQTFFVGFRAPSGTALLARCARNRIEYLTPTAPRQPGDPPAPDWGRVCPGARRCAAQILYAVYRDLETVRHLYESFAQEIIAEFRFAGFTITEDVIRQWVGEQAYLSHGAEWFDDSEVSA